MKELLLSDLHEHSRRREVHRKASVYTSAFPLEAGIATMDLEANKRPAADLVRSTAKLVKTKVFGWPYGRAEGLV
jgi:hypothetical protein